MVFHQIVATFHALFDVIGIPGNFLVIVTTVLERRFHVMRYILLASLAVSDILCLTLANSFRIGSIAQQRWLYGGTMCDLNPSFVRYFYFNSVLHLMAVSYERYNAIVKSPLTYDGTMTKCKTMLVALIWIVPVPFSIGPFLGFGNYVYNPEVFFCEQGWSVHSDSMARNIISYAIFSFLLPFLVIVFLNWRVFRTAKALQINPVANNLGCFDDSDCKRQQQNQRNKIILRKKREQKAAADVNIIIIAFLLCYLPGWITGIFRQFVKDIKVTAEVILTTTGVYFFSSVCNPIIYSLRKREFHKGFNEVVRCMTLQKNSSILDENVNPFSSFSVRARAFSSRNIPVSDFSDGQD